MGLLVEVGGIDSIKVTMKLKIDHEADALYFSLSDAPATESE